MRGRARARAQNLLGSGNKAEALIVLPDALNLLLLLVHLHPLLLREASLANFRLDPVPAV